MARNHGVRKKYGELLYRIARYYKPANIIELGTSLGLGSSYLSVAHQGCVTYSIEACPQTWDLASKNPFLRDCTNIRLVCDDVNPEWLVLGENGHRADRNTLFLICGTFEKELPGLLKQLKTVSMVFIDGDHRKQATLDNFNRILPFVGNDSILIFDDIHWSAEMEEAWNIIQGHDRVRTTVDLFQFGLVFFRNEMTPAHFILRF
jgi:predicted O-methyltransferase YrrM